MCCVCERAVEISGSISKPQPKIQHALSSLFIVVLCSCSSSPCGKATCLGQQSQDWLNQGGDLYNRRYAYKERKINPETAPNLRLKWKFNAGKDITATPAIYNGTLYFPSWNGNIYAVKEGNGSLVSKQDLQNLTGLNATGFVRSQCKLDCVKDNSHCCWGFIDC
ncbi:hypothetical protein GmHk_09G026942 [Glycine max]|nr:hypothetical protein GmHk_09G026942 [Glycine max]KAH1234847.1 hypothetical protein GmHk_09G026942 [Glycine max]